MIVTAALVAGPDAAGFFADRVADSATIAAVPGVRFYGYSIVNSFPHDSSAFTQGLVFEDGGFYEGTGLYGHSTLRRVQLQTGDVQRLRPLAPNYFGEGITVFGDRIIQLTWRSHVGFVYEKDSFEKLGEFSFPAEGWGLTHDGEHLIASDGTPRLRFLDPVTLEVVRHVDVVDGSYPVYMINELEYVKGLIYANIWLTERIAMISPKTGRVAGWVDIAGLGPCFQDVVPNGIAYDSQGGRLFVTGKHWPNVFEIELLLDSAGDFDRDGRVDMADFAVLAATWLDGAEDQSWNELCDISALPDGIVDSADMMVFARSWLGDQ